VEFALNVPPSANGTCPIRDNNIVSVLSSLWPDLWFEDDDVVMVMSRKLDLGVGLAGGGLCRRSGG